MYVCSRAYVYMYACQCVHLFTYLFYACDCPRHCLSLCAQTTIILKMTIIKFKHLQCRDWGFHTARIDLPCQGKTLILRSLTTTTRIIGKHQPGDSERETAEFEQYNFGIDFHYQSQVLNVFGYTSKMAERRNDTCRWRMAGEDSRCIVKIHLNHLDRFFKVLCETVAILQVLFF